MDILGIKRGSAVADVGAGSGWFTVRAARRVGPEGVVYAVEINREYLAHIERRAEREKLGNIRAVLGTDADPKLPAGSVDAVLLLKTYHELQHPLPLMRRLHEAMRSGARLGIIDKQGRGDDHGLDAEVVIREVGGVGFKLVEQHDFVKKEQLDYFLVLEKG
jgi:tRNA A58 N-methylase Trm61